MKAEEIEKFKDCIFVLSIEIENVNSILDSVERKNKLRDDVKNIDPKFSKDINDRIKILIGHIDHALKNINKATEIIEKLVMNKDENGRITKMKAEEIRKVETCLMLLNDGIERANSNLKRAERNIKMRDDLKDTNPEGSKDFDDKVKKNIEYAKNFLKDLDKAVETIEKIVLNKAGEGENN